MHRAVWGGRGQGEGVPGVLRDRGSPAPGTANMMGIRSRRATGTLCRTSLDALVAPPTPTSCAPRSTWCGRESSCCVAVLQLL